jgi:hypothetical protein
MKAGMATDARRPMMHTTIISSMRLKPREACRGVRGRLIGGVLGMAWR